MAVYSDFVVLMTVALFAYVHSFVRLDLNGNVWTVTQETTSGQPGETAVGRVPGSVHTALLDNGKIADPLYRDNDVNFAWIGLSNWSYSRTFSVSSEIANAKTALLISEGLDTIATVEVNGQVVGQSDNMFLRVAFDVTGILQTGDNTIKVYFESPVNEALARADNSTYIIPPECPPAVQNGQCHVNQIRKEQCSFSWDWGPSFPTLGIWKPIYIDAFDNAVIREATAVTKKVGANWQVVGEVYFDVTSGSDVTGQLSATVAELNVTYSQSVTVSSSQSGVNFTISVPDTTDVPLWWPNGYGDQRLFDLNVTFTSGIDTSQRLLRIGFRTVELVQDPVSNNAQQGLTFYFKINSIPVFLKGSNWIPADNFQERITVDRLRYLLQSAADVHTNSMRVWGGGIYESDEFYQLCDELGIMIWQDLMFSVALYPTYQGFLDSVGTEVTQQLRRLKSHPSVILWAGNNENESALRDSWFGTSAMFTLYKDDYIKLYVTTLKPIVEREDDTREFVVSSPSDGIESENQGYIAQNPGSELYGDVHFYDYSVDQWNDLSFRVPRMASEYGVQAWCNSESLSKVFDELDYRMDSAMTNHRQHHGNGNLEMATEVGMHLNLPSAVDDKTKFIDFIYLTQINQAMSIRTQTEHYRRYQSKLLSDGRGLTMGALYWQLNDIWQAPTWASIDYEGGWKMLHYYAKNFFSNLLVSPYLSGPDTLDIYVIVDEIPVKEVRDATDNSLSFQPMLEYDALASSDLPDSDLYHLLQTASAVTNGLFTMTIYDYSKFDPLKSWNISYSLNSTADSVFTKSVTELLSESGCPAKENCLLYFTVMDEFGWFVIFETWLPLAYPKVSQLQPAQIMTTSVTEDTASPSMSGFPVFTIDVISDAIALFVWLSTKNIKGYFSDNGFPMVTPRKSVMFYAQEAVTASQLMAQLNVRSVVDVISDPLLTPSVIIG